MIHHVEHVWPEKNSSGTNAEILLSTADYFCVEVPTVTRQCRGLNCPRTLKTLLKLCDVLRNTNWCESSLYERPESQIDADTVETISKSIEP